MEEVSFNYRGRKISFTAKRVSFFGRAFGLMFSSREKAKSLIFEFKEPTKTPIHSFFVFFPFIAVWLDEKNKVVDVKRVKPFNFSVSPSGYFSKLIEIPVNKKCSNIVKIISRR
ncbi:MAG: hypothetical protein AABX76_01470 [Nanoarchaeota archaeon]